MWELRCSIFTVTIGVCLPFQHMHHGDELLLIQAALAIDVKLLEGDLSIFWIQAALSVLLNGDENQHRHEILRADQAICILVHTLEELPHQLLNAPTGEPVPVLCISCRGSFVAFRLRGLRGQGISLGVQLLGKGPPHPFLYSLAHFIILIEKGLKCCLRSSGSSWRTFVDGLQRAQQALMACSIIMTFAACSKIAKRPSA
mmetsp:Transcript_147141/g.255495  ORF Transcript_147141/g.255495 Transcript_147141/m.255495 type:complete len:201 (+) Transcript_147141:397-999(+)